MTQEEKLKKVIEHVGWGKKTMPADDVNNKDCHFENYTGFDWQCVLEFKSYYSLLFNHDFAKAYWGEDSPKIMVKIDIGIGTHQDLEQWQYHLQQAVLSEDPIDYYYKNVCLTH